MLAAVLDQDEAAGALRQAAAQRNFRLAFLLAAAILSALLAPAPLALGWAGALFALELAAPPLLALIDAARTASAHAARIMISLARGCGWALGPALAWPYAPPDAHIAICLWLGALLVYAAVFSYRSLVLFVAELAPAGAAAVLLAIWATEQAAARTQLIAIAGAALGAGFAFAGGLRRREMDIRAERLQAAIAAEARNSARVAARLNFALEAFGAAIWEVDFKARRIHGAEAAAKLLHREIRFEDLAQPAPEFVHPGDAAAVRAAFARAITAGGGRVDVEHRVVRPGAGVGWLHTIGFTTLDKAGRVSRLVMMSRDATERKTLEIEFAQAMRAAESALADKRAMLVEVLRDFGAEEAAARPAPQAPADEAETGVEGFKSLFARLRRLLHEIDVRDGALTDAIAALEIARKAAEAGNLAKSQFVANMSHELRTPLNAVIGYAEILEEYLQTANLLTHAKDAARIRQAARNLLTLINEILDLAKIDAGRMEASPSEVDVRRLVRDMVDLAMPAAAAKNNEIEIAFEPGIEFARTDDRKLRQCLQNLLSNACKFTEYGQIRLSVSQIESPAGRQLQFEVRDTGVGIEPDQIEALFSPFMQGDASTTRKAGGTGLGLALTRRLARILGGDVVAAGARGHGSVFTLTVLADMGGAESEMEELGGEGPLVLIIDDEAAARDLVRRSMARLSFSTRSARDGRQGLRLARTLSPALIVLDIRLPDLSGWLVLEALKSDPVTANIPVIVLSIEDDAPRSMALGARAHLMKPADRDVLIAAAALHAASLNRDAAA